MKCEGTGRPCVKISARPLAVVIIASVATKSGILPLVMMTPVVNPVSAPVPRPKSIPTPRLSPQYDTATADTEAERARTAPTDKSIPAPIITMV
ncbi:hypothetical protein ES703_63979 [subsurface metagenome]